MDFNTSGEPLEKQISVNGIDLCITVESGDYKLKGDVVKPFFVVRATYFLSATAAFENASRNDSVNPPLEGSHNELSFGAFLGAAASEAEKLCRERCKENGWRVDKVVPSSSVSKGNDLACEVLASFR